MHNQQAAAVTYDAIIIGGGPAGLTAALYLARANCKVLLLEKHYPGGQIRITHKVDNYPGIPFADGAELAENMHRQAEHFGAEILQEEAIALNLSGHIKTVYTPQNTFRCLSVLWAAGAQPRKIGFIGEEEYTGRGVSYCAACDGRFFTGKDIFVIGGGYAAAEESVFLTRFARHVTILIRKDNFSCAASVAEEALSHGKITVLTNTVMEEVSGDHSLQYVRFRNTCTNAVTEYRTGKNDCFGVFVLAGYAPDTSLVHNMVELDKSGYIVTDAQQATGIDGLYAAGDVCSKPFRQLITAASDGAVAAASMEKHIASMRSHSMNTD